MNFTNQVKQLPGGLAILISVTPGILSSNACRCCTGTKMFRKFGVLESTGNGEDHEK